MSFRVPTVDITPYVTGEGDRAAVAAAFDAACREVGFVQVIGHGVPDGVIEGLTTAMDEFFALDLAAKKAYRTPPEINRGYSPPKSESLSLSLGVESATRMNDFFEAFNVGAARSTYGRDDLPADHYAENIWPAEVPGFERAGLGLLPRGPAGGPHPHRRGRRRARPPRRLLRRLPRPLARRPADEQLRAAARRPSTWTPTSPAWARTPTTGSSPCSGPTGSPGLQVLGSDGAWHDVEPAEGALLVNLGDLLGRWTNDRWMSTLHRVKPPVVDGTIQRRRSAAFFCDGDIDAVVSTLPQCVDAEHPDRYLPVTVDEHLTAKLAGSRAGVRNPNTGRETERVLASRE